MQKIDLHTHTTASDGIYSPSRLIDIAIEDGIIALAITDHDTVDGLAEAVEYSIGRNITLIPGIEFSIEYSGGSFHLLGLNIDYRNSRLLDECSRLAGIRENRAERIIEDLNSHGIEITLQEVESMSREGVIGRPHIARVLIQRGYGESLDEIFNNYLVKGKPGYVRKERALLDRAVSLIKESGGIPVIAHPVSLNFEDLNQFEIILKDFVNQGVMGIEAYSTMHSAEEIECFIRFAEKYKLIITGGSDFHGDKREEIGYCGDNMLIPIDILSSIVE